MPAQARTADREPSRAVTTRPPQADYLYICGSGHSGSTLLEMLLAGHDAIAALGEIQNLADQVRIQRVCSCGRLPSDCSFWKAVADRVCSRCGVNFLDDPDRFRLSRERPRNAADRLVRLLVRTASYAAYRTGLSAQAQQRLVPAGRQMARNLRLLAAAVREVAGARVLVDSSKDYVRMCDVYAAPRSGTRVIYLLRDGRGPVWSNVRNNRGLVRRLSADWAGNHRRTRQLLQRVAAEDLMSVRYERLCSDTEAVLREICDFVGLPFDDAMLDLAPPEHHSIAGNKIRVQRRMQIRADDSWREGLTAADLRQFERYAGAENRRLGYT